MWIRRALMLLGIGSKSMFCDELLILSCPEFMNSSLPDVTETFTDNEPEMGNFQKNRY